MEEYETVRLIPTHFVVTPGHVIHGVERTISVNERYAIVEKFGEAGSMAVQLDPRRRGAPTELTAMNGDRAG